MNNLTAFTLLSAGVLLTAPGPPLRRLRSVPDRDTSAKTFVARAVVVAGIFATLALPTAVTLAVFAVGAAAVARRHRRHRAVRRRREARAMAAALESIVGELKVGAHPVRAFAVAAAESDGFVAEALRTVASRAWLGAEVGAGLRAVAARSSVPAYWHRIEVCWHLAAEHGLGMSNLMRTAQSDIVERQRFADRTEAGLAGARATAAVLAALPAIGVLLGEVIGARPIAFLFGGGAGGWLLVAGLILVCAGVAWSDHIIERVTR